MIKERLSVESMRLQRDRHRVYDLHRHHDKKHGIQNLNRFVLDFSRPAVNGFVKVMHARIEKQHGNQHERHTDQHEHRTLRGTEQLSPVRRPKFLRDARVVLFVSHVPDAVVPLSTVSEPRPDVVRF